MKKMRFMGRRLKKVRGWEKKYRATAKVSDITTDGFWLHTFNKDYYISFDTFRDFRNATHEQIQNVVCIPCDYDDPTEDYDHGDIFRWELLDIDLGSNTLEFPKGIRPDSWHEQHPDYAADVGGIVELKRLVEDYKKGATYEDLGE